jgi:HK97 family phage major capsid protein
MKHSPTPRARTGAVFAAPRNDDPQALFEQINATLRENHNRTSTHLNGCEETITNLANSLGGMQRQIEGGFSNSLPSIIPQEPEYTGAFASFIRKGEGEVTLREFNAAGERAAIHAALQIGSDTDGGYLAPTEWDHKISQAQVATSPMRRLARVITTSVNAFTTLWNNNQWASGWVGETAARPQTTGPQLEQITFASGEIYAQPSATQRLLDDAPVDIAAWLTDSLRVEFNRQENLAFLSGNGVNKPFGLLQYVAGGAGDNTHPGGNLTVVESAITVDALVDFMYALAAPYRNSATWLMSSLTAAALTKMKDDNGNLIWRESLIVGQPATLLGRPVEIDEGMPGPVAGNITLAFGDFNAGYLINDRYSSLRLLRSVHQQTIRAVLCDQARGRRLARSERDPAPSHSGVAARELAGAVVWDCPPFSRTAGELTLHGGYVDSLHVPPSPTDPPNDAGANRALQRAGFGGR